MARKQCKIAGDALARKANPRKRNGRAKPKTSLAVVSKSEPQQIVAPRPRIRLRSALRAVGLDECKIAWNLNHQVDALSESTHANGAKLLLDYLKEAVRHLDPATARAADAREAPTVELVHQVVRPDRDAPN